MCRRVTLKRVEIQIEGSEKTSKELDRAHRRSAPLKATNKNHRKVKKKKKKQKPQFHIKTREHRKKPELENAHFSTIFSSTFSRFDSIIFFFAGSSSINFLRFLHWSF